MISKVVLYGSGVRCRLLCEILQQCGSGIEIAAIIDSDSNRWEHQVNGYLIECPDKIKEIQEEYLCITVADAAAIFEIRETIKRSYRYNMEKEIHYNKLILEAYKQCKTIKQYIRRQIAYSNENQTVLFDCYNGLGLGGVEAWTIDLCKALIESGKESVQIISDVGSYEVPQILNNHIIYIDINHRKRFSVNSVRKLVEVIVEKLPCKIITSTVNEVMLAAYLVKLYQPEKIQIISVIHNSNERDYEEYMDFRECPDFYIGVSQDIKDAMMQFGIEKNKICSMTCPFPCDFLLNRTYSENVSMPLRIGYAGRMEYYQKRMDLLMKLIAILVEEDIFFEIEIAGEGSARKDMEEFVSRNCLKDKVHFLGRLERTHIPEFWRNQDVCINLADFEGRSIGIMEAMGNGVVPIVTATSGVREDITDGVNGYIVPLEDYRAMADKIRILDENRGWLSEMGKRAHDTIYPKSQMKQHLKFWTEVLI